MASKMISYWIFPVDTNDAYYLMNQLESLLDDLESEGEVERQSGVRLWLEVERKFQEDVEDFLDAEDDLEYEQICD